VLTRLEVHGFKNLLNFSVDFGPFNCIAGPNGVGKSNIFDAIRFLSLLADNKIIEAALKVRTSESENAESYDLLKEPKDLFWTDGINRVETIRIAAEMIVNAEVRDDFGRSGTANSTFLRYEVEIGYDEPKSKGTLGRLVLKSEKLDYITEGAASSRLKYPFPAKDFRRHVVKNRRRTDKGYISTETAEDDQTEILVHQDGGSSGKPQRSPAISAPRTIVGTTNTSATPTILAARREMQSWSFLALEPSAMRRADRFFTDPHVTANGGHLPATLHRLAKEAEKKEEDAASVYARVANQLSEVFPVRDIRVQVDEVRQLLTLQAQELSKIFFPASSLSDGTLRFLTLCILEQDPDLRGLLCMEEPENGIHPAHMSAMVDILHDLAVDPTFPPGEDNPLRQVIVATHSPKFVELLNNKEGREELLFAKFVGVKSPFDTPTRTLRCEPLKGTWRTTEDDPGIGIGGIITYLTNIPGDQIELHFTDEK